MRNGATGALGRIAVALGVAALFALGFAADDPAGEWPQFRGVKRDGISTETGLANQGWKDSHDSVFHANGRLAEGPMALSEVQGYVYEAKRCAASCARLLNHHQRADQLERPHHHHVSCGGQARVLRVPSGADSREYRGGRQGDVHRDSCPNAGESHLWCGDGADVHGRSVMTASSDQGEDHGSCRDQRKNRQVLTGI